jgi:hypothetical protein
MKPKIRIQLREENGAVLSDRLVDQTTELATGPKEVHEGPITVEFTAMNSDDLERVVLYIQKLKKLVPIETKPPRKTYTKRKNTLNAYKELFLEVKKKPTMEKVIEHLDNLDFTWLHTQYFEELTRYGKGEFGYIHDGKYKQMQWLSRKVRTAVNPIHDLYDFRLIFGIDLIRKKSDRVVVFFDGKIKGILTKPWPEKKKNMKVKKIPLVFPTHMTIEDRKKWRAIHRKIKDDRKVNVADENFYYRYKPEIANLEHED